MAQTPVNDKIGRRPILAYRENLPAQIALREKFLQTHAVCGQKKNDRARRMAVWPSLGTPAVRPRFLKRENDCQEGIEWLLKGHPFSTKSREQRRTGGE